MRVQEGKEKVMPVKRGCLQGGIFSPFLLNLVINELLQYTRNRIPSDLQGFADDLVSIVTEPKKPAGDHVRGFNAETFER